MLFPFHFVSFLWFAILWFANAAFAESTPPVNPAPSQNGVKLSIPENNESAATIGVFDRTADWGTPEFPPKLGKNKVSGKINLATSTDGLLYDIYGNGDHIYDNSDEGFFAYAEKTGSWRLESRIELMEMGGGNNYAHSGLMIREKGGSAQSKLYSLFLVWNYINKNFMLLAAWRSKEGAAIQAAAVQEFDPQEKSFYLRVSRCASKNIFYSEWSSGNAIWNAAHFFSMEMAENAAYGAAVCNQIDNELLARARLSRVSLEYAEPFAVRFLSTNGYASDITVFLEISNPRDATAVVNVNEYLPIDWTVDSISGGGIEFDGFIRWIFPAPPGSTYLTYLAHPSANDNGQTEFRGEIGSRPIFGQNRTIFRKIRMDALRLAIFSGTPLLLFLIHICLFWFYPKSIENLFYSLFLVFAALTHYELYCTAHLPGGLAYSDKFYLFLYTQFGMLILFFHKTIYVKLTKYFWCIFTPFVLAFLYMTLVSNVTQSNYFFFRGLSYLYYFEILRIVFAAHKRRADGAALLSFGIIAYASLNLWLSLVNYWGRPNFTLPHQGSIANLLFLLSMSVYLAYRYAKTSKDLAALTAELENRVEQRTAELKAAQNHLIQSEKMASLGHLVAGIAHEINNPINFIKSNIFPLKNYLTGYKQTIGVVSNIKDQLPDDVRTQFETAVKTNDLEFVEEDIENLLHSFEEGSNRIVKIVADLRQYIRTDKRFHSVYDLRSALETSLSLLQNQYKGRIAIHSDFGGDVKLFCSPGQIDQVMMNVLKNAIEAIPGEGNIWIDVSQDDRKAIVKIRDDGRGIPPENLNRIFDPFFTTKPIGSGTGLGLSLAYNLIEQHGGEIFVESEPGRGATFTIMLPIQQEIEEDASPPSEINDMIIHDSDVKRGEKFNEFQ
ncbi:MAG: ATP-binding protein [Candidatus Omnitrophota bacterium]